MDRAISEFQTGDEPAAATNEDRDQGPESETEDVSVYDASTRMAELEVAIASTPAMITARADFEKQRMAMELAENNQDLLNKGQFIDGNVPSRPLHPRRASSPVHAMGTAA